MTGSGNDDINSLRKDLGMEFKRPGLKTDIKNDIFWPKIGQGFRALTGQNTPTKNSRQYPPGVTDVGVENSI